MKRREFLGTLLVAAVATATTLTTRLARAGVPGGLQARLISKVAAFDRNYPARAGSNAVILIVQKSGDGDSSSLASAVASALGNMGDIGGKPKTVETTTFSGASGIASTVRDKKCAIVYFSSGLEDEMGGVASALSGVDVLTFGASGAHAEKGAVVGFDLEEGKPKLVVNRSRASAQHVSFKAALLKLARLV